MQPTSLAFQTTVAGSHQSICRFDVIQNGKVVASLPIVDGNVSADRTAAQMRAFSAVIADVDGSLTPADISGLLAPFGTRCQIYRGVVIPNVVMVVDLDNSAVTFAEGNNNGTYADPLTGDLILAWGNI